MSYCRFSEGDVYMYGDVEGGFTCLACLLAPLVKSIFTTGGDLFGRHWEPCPHCQGAGCDDCMLHDELNFATRREALAHLHAHRQAGHRVPQRAFDRLEAEIEEETHRADGDA